jgi:NAD-dependent dihydropyrimidine dehydrogenase PreA subunit
MLPELFTVEEKVIVDQSLCFNYRFATGRCRKCESICPHQSVAVDFSNSAAPVTIGESCTGCGQCIAFCPTMAIRAIKKVYNPLVIKDGIANLVCTKLEYDGFIPCVGLLNIYLLCYIGIQADQVTIILDKDRCEACNPGVVETTKMLICAANEFLQKLDRPNINLSYQSGSVRENCTRRDLFVFCFSKIKETVTTAISFAVQEDQNDRDLLLNAMKQEVDRNFEQDAGPLFWGARVNDECDLCGVCVRGCKTAALIIKTDETKQKIALYHDQTKCVGCAACSLICPKAAIKVLNAFSNLGSVSKQLLTSITCRDAIHCSCCGVLIVSNRQTMCEACLYKKNWSLQAIY